MLAFSIVYWLFAVAIMPPLFAVALAIFLVTLPFDRRRLVLHLYCCAWGSLYVAANPFWRIGVEGREKLPWRGPAVLVANHLSLLDIPLLYALFRPFKWVSKGELFRVPIVGWTMAINDYVRVWRGDPESVRRMLEHCRRHIERGTPVLLFPEGTRSRDGHLQRFKDGAFRLALDTGCPVFPIAVSGTFEALPATGLSIKKGMRAQVRVLDPLRPADYPSLEQLREAARAAIASALPEEARPLHR
ncbi:MAG TPA: lysophospholipid acyltransferase family protein [Anaeromyxobacter sp.]